MARKIGIEGKKKAKKYDWKNIIKLYMDAYKTAKREFHG